MTKQKAKTPRTRLFWLQKVIFAFNKNQKLSSIHSCLFSFLSNHSHLFYFYCSFFFFFFPILLPYYYMKNLDAIGGIFVVLLCGLALAVLVAIIEFCYKSRKEENFNDPLNLLQSKSSLCAELREELCFSLNCKNANHQRQSFKRYNICPECLASKSVFIESKSHINDVI